MDELYKNWYLYEEGSKKAHSVKKERTEVLWTNYDVELANSGKNLRLLERANPNGYRTKPIR
jgi:hypothetical protein